MVCEKISCDAKKPGGTHPQHGETFQMLRKVPSECTSC